jgi:hypothetical protein
MVRMAVPAAIGTAGALQSGFSRRIVGRAEKEKARDFGVSFDFSIGPDGRENPAGSLDIGRSLC